MFHLFLLFSILRISSEVGLCDLSKPPPSWLSTNGTGISGWATSGVPTNTSSFCIQGNKTAKTLEVDYHIVEKYAKPEYLNRTRKDSQLLENSCAFKDPRIQECFPICFNETVQNVVVQAALNYGGLQNVSDNIANTLNNHWAVTVIQVDYNDPKAHLNASIFLDSDLWCSVYIGIKPTVGFAYLYEIQVAKVILE